MSITTMVSLTQQCIMLICAETTVNIEQQIAKKQIHTMDQNYQTFFFHKFEIFYF